MDLTALFPLPALAPAAAALAPLAMGLAALACGHHRPAASCWALLRAASTLALAAAGTTLALVIGTGPALQPWLRADLPGALVLLLVAFIGWVIVRYSATALQGEPRQPHYARWLGATVAGATTVLVTNHLALLALAWWFTSFSLHRLLRFYAERPAARIAAHKKFLMARAADTCLALACVLLAVQAGTLQIDALGAWAGQQARLPAAVQAALLLVALAAALKCAQLPFHGWLIQVMEAPTPVSALLHAGVVNLGGFVLLRLAPLVEHSLPAQALLVCAGTASAVLAALVMTTRISVKVALAWSTCAQMGFMLLQCGLGLWEMALLHLVAHSLYKAHAFLTAGETVQQARIARLLPRPTPAPASLVPATAGGLALVVLAATAWGVLPHAQPALLVMAGIVAFALAPLLAGDGAFAPLRAWALAMGVAALYFGLHAASARWLVPGTGFSSTLWWIPALGFLGLAGVQAALAQPRQALARRLHPGFYGGLFLDEALARLLFRLSPPPSH